MRKRNPSRDRAKELWLADTERPLKDIAKELGLPENRIRKWKSEDQWEKERNGAYEKERSFSKRVERELAVAVEENEELTEKEKAFCLHYVKSFNKSAAYIAAGYEGENPAKGGWAVLNRQRVQEEIRRLKEMRNLKMMADADDVVMLHMRIAFTDVTDIVEFGRATVPVMGPFGPIVIKDEDGNKTALTREVNEVRFKESYGVDGQVITKVKQGRDGASVELADRQKSLAFLERYFELNPMDRHKKAYDTARLEIERSKQPAQDDSGETGVIALPVLAEANDE